MEVDLLIINIGELVTCVSGGGPKKGSAMRDGAILKDAGVAVKDGKIYAVGDSETVRRLHEPADEIDAQGRAVIPGFVECHTHIVYAGDRLEEFELRIKGADYLEILAAGGGILSTVRSTREAGVGDLVHQSRTRLDRLLENGVTTCEIKTGYGLDTETEIKMLDAIAALDLAHVVDVVPTFLPAHAVPPEFRSTDEEEARKLSDEYVELICSEMIPRAALWYRGTHFNGRAGAVSGAGMNFYFDVFCEKNAFDLEQSKRLLKTAASHGFRLKAHVDEFTNLGCAEAAIGLGADSIDHLDAISDREIALLAGSDTVGVVTPAVNFNLGSREFANARRMIDAGCAIAVSTDYNPGSAPCPSPAAAMAIACRYQRLLPAEAINGFTINAAYALGLGDTVGSVEIGKQADLLVLETNDHREICYEFGGNLVGTVIKNGKESVSP